MAEHTKGKLKTDTYRVRLVFERCLHTAIGNWRDTHELNGKIFFGVSTNRFEVEKSFIQGCKAINCHDDLLTELRELVKEIEETELCENVSTEKAKVAIAKVESEGCGT